MPTHEHSEDDVTLEGSFIAGPLAGTGFMLCLAPPQHLEDLRVTLPTSGGMRDVYLYDPQPDPASHEVGLRYIGRQRA